MNGSEIEDKIRESERVRVRVRDRVCQALIFKIIYAKTGTVPVHKIFLQLKSVYPFRIQPLRVVTLR